MSMIDWKKHCRSWAKQFEFEDDKIRMLSLREHFEITPLGIGQPLIVSYSEPEFKQKLIDIIKVRAPLLVAPSNDFRTLTSENCTSTIAHSLKIATKENVTMSNNGFLKIFKSELLDSLIAHPNSLALLMLIARRVRRTDCILSGIKKGEAKIGDHEACGLTRSAYRHSLQRLIATNIVTTTTTSKGTIAKLTDSSFCDLNLDDEQPSLQPSLQPPHDHLTTTIKKERKKDIKKKEHTQSEGDFSFSEKFKCEQIAIHGKDLFTEVVQDLELYCRMHGKTYSDHEAAILNSFRLRSKTPPSSAVPPDNFSWSKQFEAETSTHVVHCGVESVEVYSKFGQSQGYAIKYSDRGFKSQLESALRKVNLWKTA